MLKGIKAHPDNPFRFDFILDKGDSGIADDQLKDESTKLIKYFLASITVPEKDLWVNLSPYEKDRIIPKSFGLTEMGRDLLAEDYMLKQITASLIYPEEQVGKKFWKRIYEEAVRKYGTTNIPVNTFNKVWIIPEKAVVYENAKAGTAYVVESKLKVMLEEDYLSLQKHSDVGAGSQPAQERAPTRGAPTVNNLHSLASQIVREIVIPELTTEINEGKNFAQLRQVYNSLILATWYKKKIKDSILAQVYADRNKVAGVGYDRSLIAKPSTIPPVSLQNDVSSINNVSLRGASETSDEAILKRTTNPNKIASPSARNDTSEGGVNDVDLIYQRYLKAFKKGVYNYIKEEQDPMTQEVIPRKYFSGGVVLGLSSPAMNATNMIATSTLEIVDGRTANQAMLKDLFSTASTATRALFRITSSLNIGRPNGAGETRNNKDPVIYRRESNKKLQARLERDRKVIESKINSLGGDLTSLPVTTKPSNTFRSVKIFKFEEGINAYEKPMFDSETRNNLSVIKEFDELNRPGRVGMVFIQGSTTMYLEQDLKPYGYKTLGEIVQNDPMFLEKNRRLIIKAAEDTFRSEPNRWFDHHDLHLENILIKLDDQGEVEDIKFIDFKRMKKVEGETLTNIKNWILGQTPMISNGVTLAWMDFSNNKELKGIRGDVDFMGSDFEGSSIIANRLGDLRHTNLRNTHIKPLDDGRRFNSTIDVRNANCEGLVIEGLDRYTIISREGALHFPEDLKTQPASFEEQLAMRRQGTPSQAMTTNLVGESNIIESNPVIASAYKEIDSVSDILDIPYPFNKAAREILKLKDEGEKIKAMAELFRMAQRKMDEIISAFPHGFGAVAGHQLAEETKSDWRLEYINNNRVKVYDEIIKTIRSSGIASKVVRQLIEFLPSKTSLFTTQTTTSEDLPNTATVKLLMTDEGLQRTVEALSIIRLFFGFDINLGKFPLESSYNDPNLIFEIAPGVFVSPVSHSYRRFILFEKGMDNQPINPIEIKIPGQEWDRYYVSEKDYLIGRQIEEVYGSNKLAADPLFIIKAQGTVNIYGRNVQFQDESLQVVGFKYVPGLRIQENINGSVSQAIGGSVTDSKAEKRSYETIVKALGRNYQEIYGGNIRALQLDIMYKIIRVIRAVHGLGYVGSTYKPEAGTDMHLGNMKIVVEETGINVQWVNDNQSLIPLINVKNPSEVMKKEIDYPRGMVGEIRVSDFGGELDEKNVFERLAAKADLELEYIKEAQKGKLSKSLGSKTSTSAGMTANRAMKSKEERPGSKAVITHPWVEKFLQSRWSLQKALDRISKANKQLLQTGSNLVEIQEISQRVESRAKKLLAIINDPNIDGMVKYALLHLTVLTVIAGTRPAGEFGQEFPWSSDEDDFKVRSKGVNYLKREDVDGFIEKMRDALRMINPDINVICTYISSSTRPDFNLFIYDRGLVKEAIQRANQNGDPDIFFDTKDKTIDEIVQVANDISRQGVNEHRGVLLGFPVEDILANRDRSKHGGDWRLNGVYGVASDIFFDKSTSHQLGWSSLGRDTAKNMLNKFELTTGVLEKVFINALNNRPIETRRERTTDEDVAMMSDMFVGVNNFNQDVLRRLAFFEMLRAEKEHYFEQLASLKGPFSGLWTDLRKVNKIKDRLSDFQWTIQFVQQRVSKIIGVYLNSNYSYQQDFSNIQNPGAYKNPGKDELLILVETNSGTQEILRVDLKEYRFWKPGDKYTHWEDYYVPNDEKPEVMRTVKRLAHEFYEKTKSRAMTTNRAMQVKTGTIKKVVKRIGLYSIYAVFIAIATQLRMSITDWKRLQSKTDYYSQGSIRKIINKESFREKFVEKAAWFSSPAVKEFISRTKLLNGDRSSMVFSSLEMIAVDSPNQESFENTLRNYLKFNMGRTFLFSKQLREQLYKNRMAFEERKLGRNTNDSRPLAIVISGFTDDFVDESLPVGELADSQYNVLYASATTFDQVMERIIDFTQFQRADIGFFNDHGRSTGLKGWFIKLDDERVSVSGEQGFRNIKVREIRANMGGRIDRIFLQACETGRSIGSRNVADLVADMTGATTYAPVRRPGFVEIYPKQANPVRYYYERHGESEEKGVVLRMSVHVAKPISMTNKSMNSKRGGIDLTSQQFLQTQNGPGGEIKFHIDPAMLTQLQASPGFEARVISIQPMNNLREFLEAPSG